ncbi:AraC family transcriptional regulator [Actinoplanes sp. N902-109]|uniref:AraC family transcriptional regulator n=1 Tax=Actinoplanes sp. (strain N902-109) TaxID=649831 RepID=UPI00032959AD|nr:AraC family transcriptional regulator [Actinoplanes sp. N902-109]AGL13668.1 transcriptional regulator [Actinoplanes sp. N902-109]
MSLQQTFRETVDGLGGDPGALAAQAGPGIDALLEHAAAALDRPDLGLLIGAHLDPAHPVGGTVADALGAATRRLLGSDVAIGQDPRGARRVVAVRPAGGPRTSAVAADLVMLWLHRSVTALTDGDYGPRSVELTRAPAADPARYTESFGAKVCFDRPVAVLRLPAGVLSRPVRHAAGERSETAWRVRETLVRRLGAAPIGLADVARSLGVHPRTLQRTLVDEGLPFAEILDCVRRRKAYEHLTTTDLPLARVAAALGLSEPAVLVRCARRWWGTSPARLRMREFTAQRA